MKEATGFRLEEFPIKKAYRKIDQMLVKELKRDALLALMRNKWERPIISSPIYIFILSKLSLNE